MIILLKIILSLIIILGGFIIKNLYKDFKLTEKTVEYEDSTIIDKIKVKIMLYFSIIAIFIFCLLLLFYVISPMQLTMW
jgi:hypothetical protein